MTSNLIFSPSTADIHPRLRFPRFAIQNPKSKIQNYLAVVAVAAAVLAAGCGLTKPSHSANAQGKPANSFNANSKNGNGTSKNDTIPNAAAVGL